jgi:hypothetical protein
MIYTVMGDDSLYKALRYNLFEKVTVESKAE